MSQYPDMTVHLCPGRRFRGLESPASRKSSGRGVGYQDVDKSFLQSNSMKIYRSIITDYREL